MKQKLLKIVSLILVLSLLAAPSAKAENEEKSDLPDIDITSWEFLVLNTYNCLTYYQPPSASFEGQGVDSRISEPLSAMLTDARNEGYELYIAAAIRNYDFQFFHFVDYLETQESSSEAVKHRHAPGTSEHQTGLGVCLTNDINLRTAYYFFDDPGMMETEVYDWLVEHCHEYGFILRYPEGKEAYYGTPCNSAHFRYVGVETATYIMENGLCLEEFLLLYDEDAVYVPEKNLKEIEEQKTGEA